MKPLAAAIVALAMSLDVAAQTPPTIEETRKLGREAVQSGNVPPPSAPSQMATPPTQAPSLPEPSHALLPPVFPRPPEGVKMAPPTDAAYQEALRDYFAYFEFGLTHRRDVFAWQLFSSRIIFWVVLSLVALGMYFAAKQFQVGLRRSHAAGAAEVTEFAASLSGVKVRSPVLGVVILVISFAFFYLYLRFVYPVDTTF